MFTVINISLRPFRPNLFSGRSPNGIIGVAGAKCILGSYDLFLFFFFFVFSFTFCVYDRWFCQHIINQECSRMVCVWERKREWRFFLRFLYYYFFSFPFLYFCSESKSISRIQMENGTWSFHLFSFKSRDFVSPLCFPFLWREMVVLGGECITRWNSCVKVPFQMLPISDWGFDWPAIIGHNTAVKSRRHNMTVWYKQTASYVIFS